MILVLNKSLKNTNVSLVDTGGAIIKKKIRRGRQNILTIINQILVNTKSIHLLEGIVVVSGPDTFSISRSNVAIANTLSFVFNTPVVGISRGEFTNGEELIKKGLGKMKRSRSQKFVLPVYSREPNIT